ncbi:MAG: hypothetical protein P4L55_11020 [Syntrophobacteraceae bacterium]|nr:hypothetical protein [Syntrophobacteraceae bacterium]
MAMYLHHFLLLLLLADYARNVVLHAGAIVFNGAMHGAKPSRRVYIAKGYGRMRPWGIAIRDCKRWLPPARIPHPWPEERFLATTRSGSAVR